jgi:hypothetical protein
MKLSLLIKIRMATVFLWISGVLAGSPLFYAIIRLRQAAQTPMGDEEYLAIIFWFFSWGLCLSVFPLIGFIHALDWRRKLQDELPGFENGDAEVPAFD